MENLFNSDSYLWIAIIGLFAGWLARLLKPGSDNMGLLWTMALGVGGSLLATLAGRQLGLYQNRAAGFIGAVVGAIILLVIVDQVRKLRQPKR